MRKTKNRQATIDTSCLCAFEHLNLFQELAFLFDVIHVSKRVRQEFRKQVHSRRVLSKVFSDFAHFVRCNAADEPSVRIMLAEFAPFQTDDARRHEGEAEAIVQASQIGAPIVIIDEKRARQWASSRGLECRGTLWVLRQLREMELILAMRPLIVKLSEKGIRLPPEAINNLLVEFEEEQIVPSY